ncbi:putative dna repair protein rad32 protein [Eutypa lata UCREL1]|uniref:Double-strand break repair protein n=1 Tax=Eutypa lata (strain UCR-EL1) TaxID=1287681 RepID=M7T0L1_EUTLA|nr:putative dna repair protein rad32 protein [Eutypa lata UCREL1]
MSSSQFTEADTIRILVATDNHVGYQEDHQFRGDDSWKAFDEIMQLARTEDVDMVLLGGDLFHDHNPSRKSVFQVMRSLRKNCLGMKPCELQFLSDADQVFGGAFGHVNYEDQDINVSIPVFSIHGNHDEPSGTGNCCSLELLDVGGLMNYFGRVSNVDDIHAKPVLLQKGQTKLALYGISHVRDERMFHTFKDQKVTWYKPNVQPKDWFNLLTVHQNQLNTNTGFHVLQPGSSVATSLVPAEAEPKYVAVVSITGKSFEVEKHRLKSVRPFILEDITLRDLPQFKGLERQKENRIEITRRLMVIVEDMIKKANADWEALQGEDFDPSLKLPLIRLKVEYTAPEGGHYDVENPQRFSQRFNNRVANSNDVVHFWRQKRLTKREKADKPSEEALAELELDLGEIKVKELVDEFLAAQSLKILPQAPFGDAVNQFVIDDDRHAMEAFVAQSLEEQVQQMMSLEEKEGDDDLTNEMEKYKNRVEKQFAIGNFKRAQRRKLKPKPNGWDSDMEGHWEDQPQAVDLAGTIADQAESTQPKGRGRKAPAKKIVRSEDEDDDMDDMLEETPAPKPKGRGRPAASTTKAKPAPAKAPAKKAPAKTPARGGRGRKAQVFLDDSDEEEEEEADVMMEDDDDDPPAPPPRRAAASRAAPKAAATPAASTSRSQPARGRAAAAAAAAAAPKARQTKLNFSQAASQQKAVELSDDEISDDDAFESIPTTRSRKR